ncbi:MAG: hypothetical protein M3Z08_13370 [Chloroflexota bacterium]|nr:hypothetical protein [Chloroflexota bacterium]
MLNYAETIRISTIVPGIPRSHSQPQDCVASTFSYVIGPIDSAQIITMHAQLSTGDECSLLLPVHVPRLILDDSAFRDGYEYSYLNEEEGDEEEEWTSSVT